MNLKQIEAFVKIADNCSFSQTAKEMYLTQPTVSAAIKTLEDELDIPLFIRSTKGVELTECGKQIYLQARQMLEASDAIMSICRKNTGEKIQNDELVIAASTIPAQFILPDLMADFSTLYPNVQFRVTVSDSEQVVNDIEYHKADIGLCGTRPEGKCFISIPFYRDELVAVVPDTEKFRRLGNIPVTEWIADESLILREDGSGTKAETLTYLESTGLMQKDLNIAVRMGNTNAILHAVRRGIGVSVVSKLAAADDVRAGHILQYPLSEQGVSRYIYIIYNSVYPRKEKIRRFINIVKQKYNVSAASGKR